MVMRKETKIMSTDNILSVLIILVSLRITTITPPFYKLKSQTQYVF